MKKELESLHTKSRCSTTNYMAEIGSLQRELDIKECMITLLLNTAKEISIVNIPQSAKLRPIFTCKNKTKANNISDMKTNQRDRKRSIDVTSNESTVTNSQALKISSFEQLKNIKLFKTKARKVLPIQVETAKKLKHQGLYRSEITLITGDSIINGVIEETINEKDRPVRVSNFPGAIVVDMEHHLIPII